MKYSPDLVQDLPIQMIQAWRCPNQGPNDDLALMEDIMKNGITDPLKLA